MTLFHVRSMPIGWVAIALTILASIGGFIFGYDMGQIPLMLTMNDFLLRFGQCQLVATDGLATVTCSMSNIRRGIFFGFLSIGSLVGALFGGPIGDACGRIRAMSVGCIICIVGIIIQLASMHGWSQFIVGRIISGLGVGLLGAIVPIYQGEAAPLQIRGALAATFQMFTTFGILTAFVISIGTRSLSNSGSWRVVLAVGIVWPSVLGVSILFMPESPRWLAAHGRLPEAAKAIARIRAVPYSKAHTHPKVQCEFEEIKAGVEGEKMLEGGWLDCFKVKHRTLYRTLLSISLMIIQQLQGVNYYYYSGPALWHIVGLSDIFVGQIILGSVNSMCTFGGVYVFEKFGRRSPLILGALWQSAWLFVFAGVGTSKVQDSPSLGKFMVFCSCMFILSYAMTWAPGIWILIGEIFPTRTRGKQAAMAAAANLLTNFLLALFTPAIDVAIAFKYQYLFASCNLVGAIVVYFFLYDSCDLSLENIDLMYLDQRCRPWTSGSWVPPQFTSRRELVQYTKRQADLAYKHSETKDALRKAAVDSTNSVPRA